MKDVRYLIRLKNGGAHRPVDQADLLAKVRALAHPLNGKVINLRVTPLALEFDLFCKPDLPIELFFDAWKELGERLTCKRIDLPPGPVEAQSIITEARNLFNEHRFWEVHEVLEGLWKVLRGQEKQLVQGLILAAAALVHAQKDEDAVAVKMLGDAIHRLENQPDTYYGWNIAAFREALAKFGVDSGRTRV